MTERRPTETQEEAATASQRIADLEATLAQALESAERMREGLERYRTLAEDTNDLVYALDANGVLTYVGPQVRSYGFDPSEVQGRRFVELISEEDRERAVHDFMRSLETGEEFPTVFRIKSKDGRVFWIEDHGKVQRNAGGEIVGINGVLRDITERKRSEEALQESELRYRTLAESSPDMIYLCDGEGRVLYVNPRSADQFGLLPAEVVGKRQEDLFPPEIAARHKRGIRSVMETGKPLMSEGLDHAFLVSGAEAWIDARLVPIRNASGEITAVLGISRDLSQRHAMERKLRERDAMLQRLASELALAEERERRNLASILHDDVGQLLATCSLKLGTLGRVGAKGKVGHVLSEMRALIDEALRKTRTLTLELTSPLLYELGLEPAVEHLCEQMQKQSGVRFVVRGDLAPTELSNDLRGLLFRAVRELLSNVIKHAHATHAGVAFRRLDGELCITVEDDGRGIEAAAAAGTAEAPGGFGLFNIRERLGYVGGSFTVDSAPTGGTRVTLVAPLAPRSAAPTAAGGESRRRPA